MLKSGLFALFSITVFALASTILCISNYDPYSGSVPEHIQFYSSLFFALAGITTFIIFYLKIKLNKNKSGALFFLPSIRQGAFVSLAVTITLLLKGLKLLDLWTIIPMTFILLLLEMFFQTKSPKAKD